MRNTKVGSAIALAVGSVSTAHAVVPTGDQCRNPETRIYIAGSPVAQPVFETTGAFRQHVFAGDSVTYKSSNGNFRAYCGISADSTFAPVGTSVVIHYRGEGESVVAVLPIAASKLVKFLDISGATALGQTMTTTGTSATVGTTDGWGGSLTLHPVEVGITDIAPGQFTAANYPYSYSPFVFGAASLNVLNSLNKTGLYGRAFVVYVNTLSLYVFGFRASPNVLGGAGQPINLSRQAVANILDGTYTDWNQVPSASGGPISTISAPITVVNREAGAAIRTSASIYFLGYNCSQTNRGISDPNPATDGYATADVLATANSTPGSITYASNDTAGGPNLTAVSLSGVAPGNLAAASGQYEWWVEAQMIKGPVPAGIAATMYNFLRDKLPTIAYVPKSANMLGIPNAGNPANIATVPVIAVGAPAVYVNPYTTSGDSCAVARGAN